MAIDSIKDDMSAWLKDVLEGCPSRHQVAGAALGLFHKGEVTVATTGISDIETDKAVTRDTLFQIGSVTKLFTAALVLRLADQGRIDLDAPLLTLLPGLRAAAWDASAITPRHLLSHTSGIEGEMLPEVLQGNHNVTSYVDMLADVPPFHAPDEWFSYCNNGYMVAAHLIEVVTGRPWHEAMRAEVLEPLCLKDIVLQPADITIRPRARGHALKDGEGGALCRSPEEFVLPACCGPVGTTPMMSVADLLKFATSVFLGEGAAVLSPAMRQALIQPAVTLPEAAAFSVRAWGLGAAISDWNGTELVGHDGDTTTFLSYLRVEPRSGIAVALLTNGGNANDLAYDVFSTIFGDLAGVAPPMITPVDNPVSAADARRYTGTYVKRNERREIVLEGDQLMFRLQNLYGPLYRESDRILQFHKQNQRAPIRLEFGGFDETDKAQTLFSGYRLSRRPQYSDQSKDSIHD